MYPCKSLDLVKPEESNKALLFYKYIFQMFDYHYLNQKKLLYYGIADMNCTLTVHFLHNHYRYP